MQRFHTIALSESVPSGMIDLDLNESPIFIGSPFLGVPSLDPEGKKIVQTNNLLILDLNVINFIRQRKNKVNIQGLLEWTAKKGLEITPIVGLSEQFRTHGDPYSAFNKYIETLKIDYQYDLSSTEVEKCFRVISNYSPKIQQNTELLRDYLIIIKFFYHQNCTLEEKVRQFAQLLYNRNVPVFAFAFLLGCVFFHVKDSPNKFSQKLVSKVQSDMAVSPNKEERKLWNVASDIMLFMAPAELFFNYETGEYNFSFIASGDITCGLILSEISYGQIVVNQNTCFGMVGLKPTGLSAPVMAHYINEYLKASPQQSFTRKGASDQRTANLKRLVSDLKLEQ